MSTQHKNLAAGRWSELTLAQQLANVGSEIYRSLNWQKKGRDDFSERAFFRALELLDLSLENAKSYSKLKELSRLRTVLVDYFFGENEFKSKQENIEKYFYSFTYAANLNK